MSAPNFYKLALEYADLDAVMERLDNPEEGAAIDGEEGSAVRAYLDALDGVLAEKLERAAVYLDLQESAEKASMKRAEEARGRAVIHKRRAERVRQAAQAIMEAAKVRKVETPEGHFSLVATAPSVVVADDVDLDALPSDCVRVKREANKVALKPRLEAGEIIPGVSLSERGVSLRVK